MTVKALLGGDQSTTDSIIRDTSSVMKCPCVLLSLCISTLLTLMLGSASVSL